MQSIGFVNEGPSNVIYFPGRTQLPIELICNVTGLPTWRVTVNNIMNEYTLNALFRGELNGHNISGNNILINVPVNNSEYVCVSNEGTTAIPSDPGFLFVAGKYIYIVLRFYIYIHTYVHTIFMYFCAQSHWYMYTYVCKYLCRVICNYIYSVFACSQLLTKVTTYMYLCIYVCI